MNGKRITGLLLVAVGLVILTLKLSRVYDPSPAITKLSAKASPGVAHFVKTTTPDMVAYILLVGLPVCIGGLLLVASKGSLTAEPKPAESHPLAVTNRGKQTRSGRVIHSCNVLDVGPRSRQIWQFDARNGGFALNREQTAL